MNESASRAPIHALAMPLLSLLILLLTAACQTQPADDTGTPTQSVAALATISVTPSPLSYPGPATVTDSPLPYPGPATRSTTVAPTATGGHRDASPTSATAGSTNGNQAFFPLVPVMGPTVTATPTSTPTPTPIPSPTSIPSPTPTPFVDFGAVRADLRASGQDLAFAKVGLHVTFLNQAEEETLYRHLERLDAAGVPFFLKSASNAEPLYHAQQMMVASGVPHTLVYRSTRWDVPNYALEPDAAAALHWQRHRDAFPPELDPSLVWIETVNEVDRNRSEWLAQFALHTAELAMADGYRWAAFGWASGEPEPEDWRSPTMLEFLRLVGDHPDQLAIALHEYSFLADDIGHQYPFKIGRFLELFRIADENGIQRPTVLITEWGWAYDEVPDPERAIFDVHWANTLYAPFPQVKGAAIWNLGDLGEKNDLSDLVWPVFSRLADYTLRQYFAVPLPPAQASLDPALYRP